MPRTDLDSVKAQLDQIAAERKLDADHIERHIEDAQQRIDGLEVIEKDIAKYFQDAREAYMSSLDSLIVGLGQILKRMKDDELQRLASLRGHHNDITQSGP